MQVFNLALTIGLISTFTVAATSIQAVQLKDGTRAFEQSPRLVDATTTLDSVRVWSAKYYFTIDLPENAGEALQQITIQQREGSEEIRFKLAETFAFQGTPQHKGEAVTVQSVSRNEQTNTISIVFEPPISPGTTFTVGFKPIRNPDYEGVYLFGVTAFPAAGESSGLYLGVGRLQFYQGGDRF